MMSKIQVDLDGIKALLESARRTGKIKQWVDIALEWMEQADEQIGKSSTSEPPKIMCDDHRDEKLEVFERIPGVFTVQLCECCVSEEKHAGFVDAEMEYKVGDYEEESTDELPTEPGWISVKDRLPESDSFCRVKLKNKEKSFDSHFYRDSYGEWWSSIKSIYDRNYTTRVTHWMLLPEGLEEE
jgi:hypothetical protein